MRRWFREEKQALRFLAAARYFLPSHLQSPAQWEEEYRDCLQYKDFEQALAWLERIGAEHAGHVDEPHFWKEMYFAAQEMKLTEHAARYEAKLQAATRGLPP